MKLKFYKRR